jgi:hypothetical protein
MLEVLGHLRFDLFVPATTVGYLKAAIESTLSLVSREVKRRFSSSWEIITGITDICDVFSSVRPSPATLALDPEYPSRRIDTEKTEMAGHQQRFGPSKIEPLRRVLGWRTLQSVDAEGVAFGPVRRKESFCYDVKVDDTLRRLMQCDSRAAGQIAASAAKWDQTTLPSTTLITPSPVYFDIPDGSAFRNHPELGDYVHPDGSMKVCLLLYYDGLGTTNPLGAFAVKHNVGCFYYAIVNLHASIRMALPYIQLVTVAYETDIKYFGMELVICGPTDEDEATGSSFGACMRRLDRKEGISFDVCQSQADGTARWQTTCTYLDTHPCIHLHTPSCIHLHAYTFIHRRTLVGVRGWMLLLAADHPAKGKLTMWKESVGARLPCPGCSWDHGTSAVDPPPQYKQRSSFLPGSSYPKHWTTRDATWIAAVKKETEAARTLTAREDVLAKHGIKAESKCLPVGRPPSHMLGPEDGAVGETGCLPNAPNMKRKARESTEVRVNGGFRQPMHRIPYAPLSAPQDLMHCTYEGILKLELGAFLYLACTKYKKTWGFSLDSLNAAIHTFPWPAGHKPPEVFKSAIEGATGGVPQTNAHVHWTASNMHHFALHSEQLFRPLLPPNFSDGSNSATALDTAPWRSWCAHIAVVHKCSLYAYTLEDVHHLDTLIHQHQDIFHNIPEYSALYKPKHHFVEHYPKDVRTLGAPAQPVALLAQLLTGSRSCALLVGQILEYGPLRHWWCFRFEAFNQIIKRIAEGSNYNNLLERIASFWCIKSARDLLSGKISDWGLTNVIKGGEETLVYRGADSVAPAINVIFLKHFPDRDTLSVSPIQILSHMNDNFEAGISYVLSRPWAKADDVMLSSKHLTSLTRIEEMYMIRGDIYLVLQQFHTFGAEGSPLENVLETSAAGQSITVSLCTLSPEKPKIIIRSLAEISMAPLHRITSPNQQSVTFSLLR